MRRVAHLLFWVAQPAGAVAIGLGLLGVAIGRWVLKREAALRAGLLLAMALAGCQTSRSAERQDSFGQQSTQRVDEGPWTREVWEYALQDGGGTGPGAPLDTTPAQRESPAVTSTVVPGVPATGHPRVGRDSYGSGGILRHVVEKHDPVTSTTTTSTEASGEAKEARSARFGFSPWQWAIGGLALLAGLWGLFRLKAKLGL